MTSQPTDSARSMQPASALGGRDDALAESDDLEEWEEVDDDEEGENGEEPRGWPLGTLLAMTTGIWLGRFFYRLPDALENVAAVLLALVTAIAAAGLYRRWVRRQFAQARARRLRNHP